MATQCLTCKGTGHVDFRTCPACDGTGEAEVHSASKQIAVPKVSRSDFAKTARTLIMVAVGSTVVALAVTAVGRRIKASGAFETLRNGASALTASVQTKNWRPGDRGYVETNGSKIELDRIGKFGIPFFINYVYFSQFCKSVNAGDADGADIALDGAKFIKNGTTFLVIEPQSIGGCEVRLTSGIGDGVSGYIHGNFMRRQ